jgi:hypothetical protein
MTRPRRAAAESSLGLMKAVAAGKVSSKHGDHNGPPLGFKRRRASKQAAVHRTRQKGGQFAKATVEVATKRFQLSVDVSLCYGELTSPRFPEAELGSLGRGGLSMPLSAVESSIPSTSSTAAGLGNLPQLSTPLATPLLSTRCQEATSALAVWASTPSVWAPTPCATTKEECQAMGNAGQTKVEAAAEDPMSVDFDHLDVMLLGLAPLQPYPFSTVSTDMGPSRYDQDFFMTSGAVTFKSPQGLATMTDDEHLEALMALYLPDFLDEELSLESGCLLDVSGHQVSRPLVVAVQVCCHAAQFHPGHAAQQAGKSTECLAAAWPEAAEYIP